MTPVTPLDPLARAARARAESDMAARPLADLEDVIGSLPPARDFSSRLKPGSGPEPRVVAEMLRGAVAQRSARDGYRRIAIGFARAGAAALCVATEPGLGGALDDLIEVRAANLPLLQNDVLVTPYQVAQARVAGADAVVLVAAVLEGAMLGLMVHAARRYGVEPVVVAHDEETVARAAGIRSRGPPAGTRSRGSPPACRGGASRWRGVLWARAATSTAWPRAATRPS
jgi:indole-3-glycerol phosphate synthase